MTDRIGARLTRAVGAFAAVLAMLSCESGTVTGPVGEVRGLVLVEAVRVEGVVVDLTGPQVRTVSTDANGRYTFADVPAGAYVVSIRNIPGDASFPATSRTAVLSRDQVVDVDFVGDFIRTASIEGTVTSATTGVPGVSVTLSGAEPSTSTVTGADGSFLFTGLRAGSYEVEISDLPETVSFPSVRTDVELAIGQRSQVSFSGVPELTATVVVRSIERRLPDASFTLADPQDLRGQIQVTLTVDGGEDTVSGVDLLLGGDVVASQEFQPGQGVPSREEGPQAAAPFDVVFSLNTAAFDPETGDVRFENGLRLLTARLATLEGGASAWLASIQVQLRNLNTFAGSVTPDRGPVLGEDGEDWIGGELEVRVLPVLYDPSRSVASAVIDVRREGGGQVRSVAVSGGAPFTVLLPAEGNPTSSNLVGYQTPVGAADQIRVVSALYQDGGTVPGVPAVIEGGLRLDNVPPPNASFFLPTQGAAADCCRSNWVGAGFAFADGVFFDEDTGVGGEHVSVHVGAAGLSDDELVAQPPVLEGGDLEATMENTALRAVARVSDDLGNAVVVPLAATSDNPATNALGGIFGVDLALPQVSFASASVPDRAINAGEGVGWVLEPVDQGSGVSSSSGARTTVGLDNPSVRGTPDACLFPGGDPCLPAPAGLVRPVPAGPEGYLRIRTSVLDRAGNRSEELTRILLRDETSPSVTSVSVPTNFSPGVPTALSAIVSDNIDLVEGWVALVFSSATVSRTAPFDFAAPIGVAFDEDLVVDGSVTQGFPLVMGLEIVVAGAEGDEPSGSPLALSGVRGVAVDAARNVGELTRSVTPVPSPTLRSFSTSERGEEGGVVEWSLSADELAVCRESAPGTSAGCGVDTPASVMLAAVARGRTGTFGRPFERVYFYRVLDGESRLIGVTAAADMSDGAGAQDRRWTWSFEWTPANATPVGSVDLLAVGVDEDGNALETRSLSTVSVVSPD